MMRGFGGLLLLASALTLGAAPLVDFPTANHAIIDGRPQDFFMYVNRDFEGEKSQPWQGGQFGYVRGPVRVGGKVLYAQIHEGIDIKPLTRDAAGNPLDPVKAAAAGKVVHVSREAGASNYGRYVVIEHQWGGSPFYTLYAHLSTIAVEPGQSVTQGQAIGQMGFTGVGIDRPRAHVHFEVCMLLSRNFDSWHATHFPGSPNKHGLYNGLNLVGMDPAKVLIASQQNENLDIRSHVASQEPAFKIGIPNKPTFDLIKNYPWLAAGQPANPQAWSITFTRHGVPTRIEALNQPLQGPVALWVKDTGDPYTYTTKGLITGVPGGSPRLTDSGQRFAALLAWP